MGEGNGEWVRRRLLMRPRRGNVVQARTVIKRTRPADLRRRPGTCRPSTGSGCRKCTPSPMTFSSFNGSAKVLRIRPNTPRAFMLSGCTVWAWRCCTSWAPIDGGTRFVPALRSATVRGSELKILARVAPSFCSSSVTSLRGGQKSHPAAGISRPQSATLLVVPYARTPVTRVVLLLPSSGLFWPDASGVTH